jgi:hypothetical protein
MPTTEILLMAAGVVFLAVSFWLGTRQNADGVATPVPSNASINHALKMQSSLNDLLSELQGLSREITDDLEQKLGQLKELLKLADNKCEALSAAVQGKGNGSEEDAREEEDTQQVEAEALEEDLERAESDLQLTVEDEEPPPMPPSRYQQIYRLADDGCSLEEIARHVRMGKGEIQLILSLRKKD